MDQFGGRQGARVCNGILASDFLAWVDQSSFPKVCHFSVLIFITTNQISREFQCLGCVYEFVYNINGARATLKMLFVPAPLPFVTSPVRHDNLGRHICGL